MFQKKNLKRKKKEYGKIDSLNYFEIFLFERKEKKLNIWEKNSFIFISGTFFLILEILKKREILIIFFSILSYPKFENTVLTYINKEHTLN